jgi:hypothetical protein
LAAENDKPSKLEKNNIDSASRFFFSSSSTGIVSWFLIFSNTSHGVGRLDIGETNKGDEDVFCDSIVLIIFERISVICLLDSS